jgi:hypothetical protein
MQPVTDEHNPMFPDDPASPAAIQDAIRAEQTSSATDDILSSLPTDAQHHDLPTPSMASLEAGSLLRDISSPVEAPTKTSDSSAILDAFPTFQDELDTFWNDPFEGHSLPTTPTSTKTNAPEGTPEPTPSEPDEEPNETHPQTTSNEAPKPAAQDVGPAHASDSYEELSMDTLSALTDFSKEGIPSISKEELEEIQESLSQQELRALAGGPIREYMKPTAAPPPVPPRPITTGMPLTSQESGELSLADFQVEESIQAKTEEQTILYLSENPVLPTLSFLEVAQEKQFKLQSTQTPKEFVRTALSTPPTALAILSVKVPGMRREIRNGLAHQEQTQHHPLFELNVETETPQIQLFWKQYTSQSIPEYQWRTWFQNIYPAPLQRDTSIVCVDLPTESESTPLFHFLCGPHFAIRHYDNPVDGIEAVYQMPPDLFAVKLSTSLEPWMNLFTELNQSARTKEIPLLLLCKERPTPESLSALENTNYLLLVEQD